MHFSTPGMAAGTTSAPRDARTIGVPDEHVSDIGGNSAMDGTETPLSHRDRAILREVGRGGAELSTGTERDLFLDGRCCADQVAAHRLARTGLIVATAPGVAGQRVAARLSVAGRLAAAPDATPVQREVVVAHPVALAASA
jgi:hypothetical protein